VVFLNCILCGSTKVFRYFKPEIELKVNSCAVAIPSQRQNRDKTKNMDLNGLNLCMVTNICALLNVMASKIKLKNTYSN